MPYALLFSENCSIAEVYELLASNYSESGLKAALKEASSAFVSDTNSNRVSLTHVFRRCLSILTEQNKRSKRLPTSVGEQSLETEGLSLSHPHNAELKPATSQPRPDDHAVSPNLDDGDDITDITDTAPKSSAVIGAPEPAQLLESPGKSKLPGISRQTSEDAHEFDTKSCSHLFRIIKAWFEELSHNPMHEKHNLLLKVFSNEQSGDLLGEDDMHSLLSETDACLIRAIKIKDLSMAEAIKEAIYMIHAILGTIFSTIGSEAMHGTSQTALTLKKLLHAFYRVDLPSIFQPLLDLTTNKLIFANNQEEARALSREVSTDQCLRLSYVTLSKILVCLASLAYCPKNLIFETRSTDSSDITAIRNINSNVYSQAINEYNFADSKSVALFESRTIPYLAAEFNFFYDLSPDLLQHTIRHSSFFSWITGDALSSSSYLYTHTEKDLTSFENQPLDPNDPFLYEVEYFEHTLKLRKLESKTQQNADLSCESYLMITTLIHSLVENSSFVEYLCNSQKLRIPILNIWFCVSSYVHHYQYKSPINKEGARMFLLTMLKLTSSRYEFLNLVNGYTINESSWKFCHHKSPIIPIDKENENRPVLFYLMDVLQVTFRFNLSKKLDLTNVKLALSVLYQILVHYEKNPSDEIKSYHWKELFVSLVNMIRFISKTHNEEGVKFVIEEVFATFDLLLSPVFDRVIVGTAGSTLFGSHLVKALNYDLLYIMLQQREALSALFSKYIVQTDNFTRVEKTFDTFEEKLQAVKSAELSEQEVQQMISTLSILSEEELHLTTVTLEDFNNVDTFKYLYDFDNKAIEQLQQESTVPQLLLAIQWTPEKVH